MHNWKPQDWMAWNPSTEEALGDLIFIEYATECFPN